MDLQLQKLREVTPEQVREVARKYFTDDALTIAHLDPQPLEGRRPAAPAGRACAMRSRVLIAAWRARRRLLRGSRRRSPARAMLPIQHWQTSSGARVYFVENHDLPMLDVSVEFPAGAGYDRAEKAGRREP